MRAYPGLTRRHNMRIFACWDDTQHENHCKIFAYWLRATNSYDPVAVLLKSVATWYFLELSNLLAFRTWFHFHDISLCRDSLGYFRGTNDKSYPVYSSAIHFT